MEEDEERIMALLIDALKSYSTQLMGTVIVVN
jgi:hypothetical protein